MGECQGHFLAFIGVCISIEIVVVSRLFQKDLAFSGLPSNGARVAPNSLVLWLDPPPEPEPYPVAIVNAVTWGGFVAWGGIVGVWVILGGGVTTLTGGITGGSTEEVAVGVVKMTGMFLELG